MQSHCYPMCGDQQAGNRHNSAIRECSLFLSLSLSAQLTCCKLHEANEIAA